MSEKIIIAPGNSSFGFIFAMERNGGGTGTNPKTYAIDDPLNQFLKGSTSDNAAAVSLGWPSDPGDSLDPANRQPPGSRVYDPDVSPNNIRLSQVSLQSVRYSHGIMRENGRQYLPSSNFFSRSNAGAAVDTIIGDLSGCRRITVQLVSESAPEPPPEEPEASIIVNGIVLSRLVTAGFAQMPQLHTFHLNNLGAVQVTNLSGSVVTVGVHVELSL